MLHLEARSCAFLVTPRLSGFIESVRLRAAPTKRHRFREKTTPSPKRIHSVHCSAQAAPGAKQKEEWSPLSLTIQPEQYNQRNFHNFVDIGDH